jgi:peroxiredoxin family protein
MKPTLVIFLHSHRYDRLLQAMSLLLTASSMGWPCHLFLFYGALASYMGGGWDEVNLASGQTDGVHNLEPRPVWADKLQAHFEQGDNLSLYEMLKKARAESGGVGVCACSASCKSLGLDPTSVREMVDEIVGLPTMVRIAEEAKHVMYV